ncbi:4761_t:CDS:2, partial [Scutellospora calospora]
MSFKLIDVENEFELERVEKIDSGATGKVFKYYSKKHRKFYAFKEPHKDINSEDVINEDDHIKNLVIGGKRETPVPGTPNGFKSIYIKAWDQNPEQRPTIEQIIFDLNEIN